jgi:phospholipase C
MSLVVSRRQVLKAGAALGAGLTLGDLSIIRRAAAASSLPPTGVNAPFDHVVVCMMENRSFDHFLGWMAATDPRVDGIQAGLQFTDKKGVTYPTYNLAPDYEGCGYADPDHSWQGGLAQLDSGRMDGFLMTATPGDTLPIGYYTKDTVSVLGTLAQSYGTSDRYFCSILSATYPNRFYQHCARTDRDTTGDSSISTLPAIWDRLQPLASTPVGPAPTGRYYWSSTPTRSRPAIRARLVDDGRVWPLSICEISCLVSSSPARTAWVRPSACRRALMRWPTSNAAALGIAAREVAPAAMLVLFPGRW